METDRIERDSLSELYDSLIKELEVGLQDGSEADDLFRYKELINA